MLIESDASLDSINYNNYNIDEIIGFLKNKNDHKLRMLITWLIRGRHYEYILYDTRVALADNERIANKQINEIFK